AAGLRGKVVCLYAVLIAANLGAWAWAIAAFSGNAVLLGTALLAYGLGLRHAVDADHVAAIDNATRKLMQEGKRPIGLGFFFALGHSTVVIVAGSAIALVAGSVQSRFPGLIETSSAIGMAASACFLLIIGALNTVLLVTVWRAIRQRGKTGDAGQRQLDAVLGRSGLFARLFRSLFGLIARSWHMYPLGFLFGSVLTPQARSGSLGLPRARRQRDCRPDQSWCSRHCLWPECRWSTRLTVC